MFLKSAVCALLISALPIAAQVAPTNPVPVRAVVVDGITSTAASVIDNRSAAVRASTMHTFCATGTGTWSAQLQYSDVSAIGPWTNFENAGSLVSQDSDVCFGNGFGYHAFIRFLISGTARVSYRGVRDLFVPPYSAAGSVSSVSLTVPSFLSVAGSPITESGTFAISLAQQSANTAFLGPSAGGAATPTFRAITDSDIPNNITIDLAAAANALSFNGANCLAGNANLGVDAFGAAEDCFDVATQSELNALSSVYQGLDEDLTSIAALATQAFGRSLLEVSSAANLKALLDLEVNVDVQAYSATLSTYAGIAPSAAVQALLGAADNAAILTLLSAPSITGPITPGNCVEWASATSLGDPGGPCGSASVTPGSISDASVGACDSASSTAYDCDTPGGDTPEAGDEFSIDPDIDATQPMSGPLTLDINGVTADLLYPGGEDTGAGSLCDEKRARVMYNGAAWIKLGGEECGPSFRTMQAKEATDVGTPDPGLGVCFFDDDELREVCKNENGDLHGGVKDGVCPGGQFFNGNTAGVLGCGTPAGGGGGGGGAENHKTSFTGQTTVTVTAATHGFSHDKILVACYDNSNPRLQIFPNLISVDPDDFEVVIGFASAQSGDCILNGSGGNLGPFEQSFTAQTTVAIAHNLNTEQVGAFCYDASGVRVVPNTETITDADIYTVTFLVAQTGKCVVVTN